MKRLLRGAALLAAVTCLAVGSQVVVGNEKKDKVVTFGALEAQAAKDVQTKAEAWLKQVAPGEMAKFKALWDQDERTVLDRLADTFALGNADAAKLLQQARDPLAPAPEAVPALFKDDKQAVFFRANLGLAYARALSNRRIHEDALDVLQLFRAEQVIDPSTYLFHRAVCEHALLLKKDGEKTIVRLLTDAVDSPERYKIVGALMLLDMKTWKDKDLAAVGRKMKNVEDRLQQARGGPKTQKLQKEIIDRLDELIKELENKAKQQQQGGGGGGGGGGQQPGQPNDGGCPPGDGQGNGNQQGNQSGNPTAPRKDSGIGGPEGSGKQNAAKDKAKLKETWGNLPDREISQAELQLNELRNGLQPNHRQAYENYNKLIEKSKQK